MQARATECHRQCMIMIISSSFPEAKADLMVETMFDDFDHADLVSLAKRGTVSGRVDPLSDTSLSLAVCHHKGENYSLDDRRGQRQEAAEGARGQALPLKSPVAFTQPPVDVPRACSKADSNKADSRRLRATCKPVSVRVFVFVSCRAPSSAQIQLPCLLQLDLR